MFSLPAETFDDGGALIITANGVLIRVQETGESVIVR